ncbi:MAG: carboxypeptidase regulatory-like domain-containing protein, partial [Myxococcaceae bacterium]|nr:carboxypeptidase regulatory-like domain-containing protein [Myxococcaceae bacterium]
MLRFLWTWAVVGGLGLSACGGSQPGGEPDAGTLPDAGAQVGRISGSVLLEGAGNHDGISVTLAGRSTGATTAADGHFALEDVPPGVYALSAQKAGYLQRQTEVVVTAGQTASAHLTLPRQRGNVAGRVLLAGTNNHAGVTVSITGHSGQATTSANGDFALQGVLPGSYTLVAQKAGWVDGQVQVTVAPTETSLVNLTLEQVPPAVPTMAVRGGELTLPGSGFGAQQGGSTVRVGGVAVETVVSWADHLVQVRVPATAPLGVGTAEVVVASPARTVEVPVRVLAPATFALSDARVLAVTDTGSPVAWGSNEWGQRDVPPGLGSVLSVEVSPFHSLALQPDGTVVAWGNNEEAQLEVPAGLSDVVAVEVGIWHNLALKADGTVAAWGFLVPGQHQPPEGLAGVVQVTAGAFHSLALKADGSIV